ncbi:MAG TPA: hypothetical protein VFE42_33005 [Chloroflexota bacterium]|nr:hypothetical protein [Chloroflexota bacterium]
MSQMRYTIFHRDGGVSFVGDEFMLHSLVAACCSNPTTLNGFLDALHEFDRRPRDMVLNGLAIFDEHNVAGSYGSIHRVLDETPAVEVPPFRVVDERTRQASLQPVKAGLVIFNLKDRRIVQMQNSASPSEVERSGTAQHHNGLSWTRRLHHYELPAGWRIVP